MTTYAGPLPPPPAPRSRKDTSHRPTAPTHHLHQRLKPGNGGPTVAAVAAASQAGSQSPVGGWASCSLCDSGGVGANGVAAPTKAGSMEGRAVVLPHALPCPQGQQQQQQEQPFVLSGQDQAPPAKPVRPPADCQRLLQQQQQQQQPASHSGGHSRSLSDIPSSQAAARPLTAPNSPPLVPW